MENRIAGIAIACVCLTLLMAGAQPGNAQADSDVLVARQARDHTDVVSLQKLIESARRSAQQHGTTEPYQRLAQFDLWLCEAAHHNNDDKLIERAARDGVSAAEKAVALNPNSSEAHRLEGDALGELIPHVFAGGLRYGRRSTAELDKAIALNPKNVHAYIGRAMNYFFTPAAFGGSRDKAIELLQKAIALDPSLDTAHIWLAQVYLAAGRHDDALREINEARRLNPERLFASYVYAQIAAESKKEAKAR